MNRLPRVIAMLVVLALVAPEIRREQAERQLAQATARIDPVLRGDLQGAPAVAAAADAATLAAAAARALPGDPRPPLPGAIAAMLLGRTDVAVTLLATLGLTSPRFRERPIRAVLAPRSGM